MGIFLTLTIVLVVIISLIRSGNKKSARIRDLKQAYERSLNGTDKRAALSAGRAYYSALREHKALTIFDEQSITNDLSAMKNPIADHHVSFPPLKTP